MTIIFVIKKYFTSVPATVVKMIVGVRNIDFESIFSWHRKYYITFLCFPGSALLTPSYPYEPLNQPMMKPVANDDIAMAIAIKPKVIFLVSPQFI